MTSRQIELYNEFLNRVWINVQSVTTDEQFNTQYLFSAIGLDCTKYLSISYFLNSDEIN